jgi:hypothetical protein
VCVVSQAAALLLIEMIVFDDEYVVSQAVSLVSIEDERMETLSFSSRSVPMIELYVPPTE